ncbi:hypothetical protein D3C72_1847700 [compost metagenome]
MTVPVNLVRNEFAQDKLSIDGMGARVWETMRTDTQSTPTTIIRNPAENSS